MNCERLRNCPYFFQADVITYLKFQTLLIIFVLLYLGSLQLMFFSAFALFLYSAVLFFQESSCILKGSHVPKELEYVYVYVYVCNFPLNEVKLRDCLIPRTIHGVYCFKCIALMLRKGLSID